MKIKFAFFALMIWISFAAGIGAAGSRPASFRETPETEDASFFADDPLLEGYIREALERNPSLQRDIAQYRASLQKVHQLTSLPDPMFQYNQFVRSVETRVGPRLNNFSLSQKFPWFGKLDLQGQVAFKESVALYQAFRAREREVIAEVKRAFYEIAYVDRSTEISQEERLLLAHYEKLSQARYSQGTGLQQAVIKIQAEITRILDRLALLARQRETLVARLNTLRDQPPENPIPRIGVDSLPDFTLNLEQLYDLGEENRQELKMVMARIEKNERSIELAKKDYWPDFTLSAGMVNVGNRSDMQGIISPPPNNGKNAFNFSIGINIPIWRDKYHAGVVEATERSIAERKNYVQIRNEIEYSIRDQVVRLETLRDQMDLYEKILIPQAEEALRSTEAGYETGQVGALDLLDSERFLLRSRLIQVRYETDYLQAMTNLERAVGTRFPK